MHHQDFQSRCQESWQKNQDVPTRPVLMHPSACTLCHRVRPRKLWEFRQIVVRLFSTSKYESGQSECPCNLCFLCACPQACCTRSVWPSLRTTTTKTTTDGRTVCVAGLNLLTHQSAAMPRLHERLSCCQSGACFTGLIDGTGIDVTSLKALKKAECKVELVFHWIQSIVVCSIDCGIMSAPSPILTRAYSELASGMVKFHDCLKIARIAVPFPYSQATLMLLVIHWIVTPFVMVLGTQTPAVSCASACAGPGYSVGAICTFPCPRRHHLYHCVHFVEPAFHSN